MPKERSTCTEGASPAVVLENKELLHCFQVPWERQTPITRNGLRKELLRNVENGLQIRRSLLPATRGSSARLLRNANQKSRTCQTLLLRRRRRPSKKRQITMERHTQRRYPLQQPSRKNSLQSPKSPSFHPWRGKAPSRYWTSVRRWRPS